MRWKRRTPQIFSSETMPGFLTRCFADLDEAVARTHANKVELLLVLDRQAGARHLPQPAENLFQTCHLVLGLPRCPAKDPGRRPRALAPRSHPPKRLSVVHIKPPWPLSAGETDQVH